MRANDTMKRTTSRRGGDRRAMGRGIGAEIVTKAPTCECKRYPPDSRESSFTDKSRSLYSFSLQITGFSESSWLTVRPRPASVTGSPVIEFPNPLKFPLNLID